MIAAGIAMRQVDQSLGGRSDFAQFLFDVVRAGIVGDHLGDFRQITGCAR